jgi:hypothetical protein
MKFVFMHRSIAERDAIGSDIVGMYDLLSSRHECYLYAQFNEIDGRKMLSRD